MGIVYTLIVPQDEKRSFRKWKTNNEIGHHLDFYIFLVHLWLSSRYTIGSSPISSTKAQIPS